MEAAIAAGETRLRPVLMTAGAMFVGLLPMAIGIGEGSEQNAALARAVLGGISVGTCSTLLFVPFLYALLRRGEAKPWKITYDRYSRPPAPRKRILLFVLVPVVAVAGAGRLPALAHLCGCRGNPEAAAGFRATRAHGDGQEGWTRAVETDACPARPRHSTPPICFPAPPAMWRSGGSISAAGSMPATCCCASRPPIWTSSLHRRRPRSARTRPPCAGAGSGAIGRGQHQTGRYDEVPRPRPWPTRAGRPSRTPTTRQRTSRSRRRVSPTPRPASRWPRPT